MDGCHRAGQLHDADRHMGRLCPPLRLAGQDGVTIPGRTRGPGLTTSFGRGSNKDKAEPRLGTGLGRLQPQVGSGETLEGHRALLVAECLTAGEHGRGLRGAIDGV